MEFSPQDHLVNQGRAILESEAKSLSEMASRLGDDFSNAIHLILSREGKVVVTGLGKSGHVARKIAATLSSTGTSAFFLHPAEALHGDLGMIDKGDTVLALSKSGNTAEIMALIPFLKRLSIPIISMVARSDSEMAGVSDVVLATGVETEAGLHGIAPTSSTTAMMALGDALALVLLSERRFGVTDFANLHPGGALGRRYFLRVSSIMHKGSSIPSVQAGTSLGDAIIEMTGKKLGLTTILSENGTLLGILTDGDLRRAISMVSKISSDSMGSSLLSRPVEEFMSTHPVTISGNTLASEAVRIMEEKKISQLVVLADNDNKLEGVLHFHDCLREKIV
ncbi:KpsF/GutQ family sugar-phosphate isomerase [Leptospirillum ferrooxidans]|jgi:arabinose-5-phosphate isomerase|uniref:Putative sugar isomerase, KpsF/GutQ family n=1 Tax=Leptospirillum ferrooxidans (strain C2-3) TaxID=1162668 RepID=I0IMG8_LEPFC|nr:KpsF/GutQ family sugar-phosphate isomerase [Leptospirillum ferrooxidans]BAM06467.1 putative sugar isomerase, KpsF/GutQ family [Leptospirillum ferrooxidans C2-3]